MYVIGVYDISTIQKQGKARLPKIMKLFRKYLHHTQKSVFEGEITEADFLKLKYEAESIINDIEDYVVFYLVPNVKNINRVNIGIEFDPNDTII